MTIMQNKNILISECLEVYKEVNKHGFRFRAINRHMLGFISLSGGKSLTDTVDKMKEQLMLKSQVDVVKVRNQLLKKYNDFIAYADKEVCVLKLGGLQL
ncbi:MULTISPECIES: hypothetical protein [unclassified Halomonas]|uniref:hypothetical protein n=1 Tax=unclassified Halomonas TaxID=2609666 RepID=UPI0007D9D454|nr:MULTISPECIES: hypothetical protein [unclassified Halomonas]MBT2785400.1 hypothetical protein [Halomonas sp. ISL-106]MBT2799421.1 hypothetical protein [Halomonas sp. ISL-104]OAL59674.1 hypothetical protein A6R74_03300 [Halomonas sp. ALS9]